jgi:hypothetical protein
MYDGFLAAVVDRVDDNILLSNEVKVLSWNYDSQIERAFFQYWGRSTGLYDALQAFPIHYREKRTMDPSRFCVIRLNGIAGLHLADGSRIGRPDNLFSLVDEDKALGPLAEMYDVYTTAPESAYPLFDFA